MSYQVVNRLYLTHWQGTRLKLATAISIAPISRCNSMAGHQVVQIEPTGGSLGIQRDKKLDVNGDEIIAEAECDHDAVCDEVCCMYTRTSYFIPSGLFYYCFAVCTGMNAMHSWRLHLTSTGIRYTDVMKLCCCSYDHHFISLGDISEVQVRGRTVLLTMKGGVEVSSLSITHVRNAREFASAVKRQMACQ